MDRIRAFAKYVLSFRRSTWTARDYPLRIRRQENVPERNRWAVSIHRWPGIVGLGATCEDALDELDLRLAERRQGEGSLPRPGTEVPPVFAPTTRVDRHPELLRRLLREVFDLDPELTWISDGSSFLHFCVDDAAACERIRAVFGVDVSDVEDGNVATVLERIAEHESELRERRDRAS